MKRCFALAVLASLSWTSISLAEDEAQPKEPPSIEYAGSRSSSAWVALPNGTRVAVDEGVEWQGIKVYLALTHSLVAVDVESGKTLWGMNTSAFWNAIGFKELELEPGKKTWAVELRPGRDARQGNDLVQYHELRTGKKLDMPGLVRKPTGTPFEPRAYSGGQSAIAKKFRVFATTQASWNTLKERMFEKPPKFDPVDFTTHVVLVISSGNSYNCSGFGVAEAYDDDRRVLIRMSARTFQTMGRGMATRPWGIFVLPRHAKKAYVAESNAQSYIGGPAIWRETFRVEKLPEPAKELDALPPRSDTPHK